jgi:hypothetical protein
MAMPLLTSSARPASTTIREEPTPESPAVSANGTVRPSLNPIMTSRTTSGSTRCLWSCLRFRQQTPRTPLCFSHFILRIDEEDWSRTTLSLSPFACSMVADEVVPYCLEGDAVHNLLLSEFCASGRLFRRDTDGPVAMIEVHPPALPWQLQLSQAIAKKCVGGDHGGSGC